VALFVFLRVFNGAAIGRTLLVIFVVDYNKFIFSGRRCSFSRLMKTRNIVLS